LAKASESRQSNRNKSHKTSTEFYIGQNRFGDNRQLDDHTTSHVAGGTVYYGDHDNTTGLLRYSTKGAEPVTTL
jgi:hypothetical protein